MIEVLRTPDARFAGLPDYDFAPNYIGVEAPDGTPLRMHFLDEGPRDAPVVLLLHGEPTWSFLYRKVVPRVAAAGFRAIAPDHIGFGRSDKLGDPTLYTFERHVEWLRTLLRELDLEDVTLVCQDWGGPIGLNALAAEEARFSAVVAANTILPTADPELTRDVLEWRSDSLLSWIVMSQRLPTFPVGEIVSGVCVRSISPEIVAGYDAPFPDERSKAGVRQFPILIPITPDDPGAALNRETWKTLERWTKPFVTAFSDSDLNTRGWERIFQNRVPGARRQPHVTIERAGHFVQEDAGEVLAEVVIDTARRSRG